MQKIISMTSLAALLSLSLFAACVTDPADDPNEPDLELASVEQGAYTAWYDLSGPYGSGIVRACKTSTRVYWQYAYNTYTTAATSGDGISYLESNIAGSSTGTKYRTRGAATYFVISLGTNLHWKGIQYPISSLPSC